MGGSVDQFLFTTKIQTDVIGDENDENNENFVYTTNRYKSRM